MISVIVSGSRDWPSRDQAVIFQALTKLREENRMMLLVHGACPTGVDALADFWARANGFPCARMPAWFDALGLKAGPMRNRWMLDAFPGACVLAFPLPGSKGTRDMITQARTLGRTVWVHKEAL